MTNINSDVLPELNWASRLGASSLRLTGLTGAGLLANTGAYAVPRVRAEVSFVDLPMQPDGVATLLGRTNIHNYMTRAYAVGEGASGPPREDPV
ncbi:MAG: hypothetical protein ACRDOH_23690 [Streptosporangiaceae bacterium]